MAWIQAGQVVRWGWSIGFIVRETKARSQTKKIE